MLAIYEPAVSGRTSDEWQFELDLEQAKSGAAAATDRSSMSIHTRERARKTLLPVSSLSLAAENGLVKLQGVLTVIELLLGSLSRTTRHFGE